MGADMIPTLCEHWVLLSQIILNSSFTSIEMFPHMPVLIITQLKTQSSPSKDIWHFVSVQLSPLHTLL